MMEHTLRPPNWKEYIFHMGISWKSQSIMVSEIFLGGEREQQSSTSSRILRTSESIRKKKTLMMITLFLTKYITNGFFQSILGSEITPVGKEENKARHAVFLTPLNPFRRTRKRRSLIPITQFLKKLHMQSNGNATKMLMKEAQDQGLEFWQTLWKHNQDALFWIKLSRAQNQGLQFGQTKSHAIITYVTVPGDCIDRVISQNRDRVIFERLATQGPHPRSR